MLKKKCRQMQFLTSGIPYHTIYKYHFVVRFWVVCGCMRVCDTSLEPSRHPHERMPGARAPARAARLQMAKMCFLLHMAPPNDCFKTVCGCVRVCDTSLDPSRHPFKRTPAARAPVPAARPQMAKMCFLLHKAPPNDRFKTR